ncbi:flippase [Paenibacillus tarimensis]
MNNHYKYVVNRVDDLHILGKIKHLIKSKKKDKNIYANIGWLLFEKLFKMVLSFFIFALIARYLGPEEFGIFNYAIAFVFILSSLIDLGLSGLVVKELVEKKDETEKIIGTTLTLKWIASVIGFITLAVLLLFMESREIMLVTLLVGISILLKPLEVIDIYNQANVISKYTVIARNSSLAVVSIVQLCFILMNYSLHYFAAAQTLEILLSVVFLLIFYKKRNQTLKWRFDIKLGLNLLKRSWPLIFSGIAAVLYLKVDQLMIRNMVGASELGIYSVAARVSEVWYFIPTAVAASFFPQLVKMKEDKVQYNNKLQAIYNNLFLSAFILAVGITLTSPFIIRVLFGHEYAGASIILTIHIWASVFVFMRSLLSKWLINEELLIFSLVSHGLGVVANIGLNLILIPSYGGIGAAIATVFAYSSSTYLFCFLSKRTMSAGVMMSKAMLSPIAIFLALFKKRRDFERSSKIPM